MPALEALPTMDQGLPCDLLKPQGSSRSDAVLVPSSCLNAGGAASALALSNPSHQEETGRTLLWGPHGAQLSLHPPQ